MRQIGSVLIEPPLHVVYDTGEFAALLD